MLVEFRKVIDYRQYLFRHLMSDLTDAGGMEISLLKLLVNWLYPTLEASHRTLQILFLKFLATLSEAFDAVGPSKSTTLRTITKRILDKSKDVSMRRCYT